jgi:hypothetical protein
MEKICGNCKYRGDEIEMCLGEDRDFEYGGSGFFLCTRILHDENYTPEKGSGAVVQDGSGYHAKLCVESDFGCIAFASIDTCA